LKLAVNRLLIGAEKDRETGPERKSAGHTKRNQRISS
jgi:hypothetical protein